MMAKITKRDEIWASLPQPWDLVVIGGGITGAGVLREAVQLGLRTLLVEQRDYAWGTSSRSSKLVHGGLRYLKEGKVGLTRASVREREQLLQDGPGLIDPMGFLLTVYRDDSPGRWSFELGLSVYDLLALQWEHQYYGPDDFCLLAPHISQEQLRGGFRYGDAQTDDARLVLRVIQEAVSGGGVAINYVTAESLLRNEAGKVTGLRLRDCLTNRSVEVSARAVVNATGAWADQLRQQLGLGSRIRPLRGSHLILPAWRLPAPQAISFLHPLDNRPVFIFPWEGVTLVGTTDVDHAEGLEKDPSISPQEVAYLMAAIESQFPSLEITLDDVVSTFAGVRPVIGSGKVDPSRESREHVVWEEEGLLTVTGGKLTTFRVIAQDVLRTLHASIPGVPEPEGRLPVLDPVDITLECLEDLGEETCRRILGRYGRKAQDLVNAAQDDELSFIPGTRYLWAELRWAARAEDVVHLDDLLLRRVRLGLLAPSGGAELLPRVRQICQPELGWDDARWEEEQAAYLALWEMSYSLPDREAVPDWQEMLAEVKAYRRACRETNRRKRRRQATLAVLLAGGIAGIGAAMMHRRKSART